MRSTKFMCLSAAGLFAVLALPVELAAQSHSPSIADAHPHHYRFVDLGTLGGPKVGISCCGEVPTILNNRGTVVGDADTSLSNPYFAIENPIIPPDPFINVAVAWHHGSPTPTNLGALPGGHNSFGNAITANGAVVGVSDTDRIDPRLGVVEAHPTLWTHSETIDLGSFGGGEGSGSEANKSGQVVGFAQNSKSDPFGYFGFQTQTRAFLWQKGALRDLGTLGTGNDASAVFINDSGQIAGVSYTNTTPNPSTGVPTQDPFFWDNDKMVDLGTLGGVYASAAALNNLGQVAGNSDLADVTAFPHAFLWSRKTGMQDLGTLGGTFSQADDLTGAGDVVGASTISGDQTFFAVLWKNGAIKALGVLPGDCYSSAYAINSKRQIVGDSYDCNFLTRPFLWENGEMIDLQKFVPTDADMILSEPSSINDRGEIAGYGFLSNGTANAFLLIPCDQGEPGCDDGTANTGSAALESNQVSTSWSSVTQSQGNATVKNMIALLSARANRQHRIPRARD
jgi:probable HAF family extracellular repeat protein